MAADSRRPTPLLIGPLFRDVIRLSGVHRGRLWANIGLPLLLVLVIGILLALAGPNLHRALRVLLGATAATCVISIAIGVQRVVLLVEVEGFGSGAGLRRNLGRFLRYLSAVAVLLAAFVAIARVVRFAALMILDGWPRELWPGWIDVLASACALIALARFLLVLPAIAVDESAPVKAAWRLARGNAWRIAFVFAAIPWIAQAYIAWMYPQGTNWLEFVVLLMLLVLLGVFHSAAMAFAFRGVSR